MTRTVLILLVAIAAVSPAMAGVLSSDGGESHRESSVESALDDPRIDVVSPDEAGMLAVGVTPGTPGTPGMAGADRRAPARGRESPAANSAQQSLQDPLASTLRGMVNVTAGNNGGSQPAPGGATAQAAVGARATGAPVERDEALEARIAAVKASLAEGIEATLSPEVDERGKVSFSVLGVEGFHADASGGKVSVGFRDSGFEPVIRSPGSLPSSVGGNLAPRPEPDAGERLMLFRVLFGVWDVITHPMTLGLLAFALVMRVALAVGRIKQIR